jgi:DhnA family fructose-bisphosphate aldolase class Ia
MRIKEERIRKFFNTDTGKSVIVPTDLGMFGVRQHLEDPVATVERLAG